MELKDFTETMRSMPLLMQAFTCRFSTLENKSKKQPHKQPLPRTIKTHIFNGQDTVTISRGDLFKLALFPDKERFLLSTFIWGYPAGGQGSRFKDFLKAYVEISGWFPGREQKVIPSWKGELNRLDKLSGVGLSTYSKILYFMGVKVEGFDALILDKRICDVISNEVFRDFENIKNLTFGNASVKYVEYLEEMARISSRLKVKPDSLEMFLFTFGLNLKP